MIAWLARQLIRLLGWRIEGQLPDVPKAVLVAAHHTSNFDGVMLILVSLALRVRIAWLAKHSLFWWPLGPILRAFGALSIDRAASANTVDQVVARLRQADRLYLVLSPEGTRKHVRRWKTGFYWIAVYANVPIILTYIDYRRKVAGIGPTVIPSGDIEADVAGIGDFYRSITPRYPAQAGEVRVTSRVRSAPAETDPGNV